MFGKKSSHPLLATDLEQRQKAAEAEAARVAGRLAAWRLAEDRENAVDRARAAIEKAKRRQSR